MSLKNKIKKVLIPNRGEMAVRIQRTCRELGIVTVAVFSEPDRHALHVRYADEAYPLPGSAPGDTYLNGEQIIKIAQKSHSDAIHPGYGFLSENAEFARLCEKNGLLFVGPSAQAIQMMGLKTGARQVMTTAGVPVVPGTGPVDSAEIGMNLASGIGYPILIKASAGGGGKGMRKVDHPEDFLSNYETCRREAQSAFADSQVYIEKYLENPRHVEFQVMGDVFGNIIHLFERECSIQRRHQKIIEETPSPILDEKLREQMGEVAVTAARACNYYNAGTVEFLVDKNKKFYFLEMNTRLQVEHPITEMITGLDLVEHQLRIAAGEPLTIHHLPRRGAAMECRIYAENPAENFLPSPGLITVLTNPGGPGVRNDSGVYAGYTIPMEYDPLISKLVVYGENREQVLARMRRALEEYQVHGIHTNIHYLRNILRHPHFISGNYDTHFIPGIHQQLLETENSATEHECVALATAVLLTMRREKDHSPLSTPKPSPWKLSGRINPK